MPSPLLLFLFLPLLLVLPHLPVLSIPLIYMSTTHIHTLSLFSVCLVLSSNRTWEIFSPVATETLLGESELSFLILYGTRVKNISWADVLETESKEVDVQWYELWVKMPGKCLWSLSHQYRSVGQSFQIFLRSTMSRPVITGVKPSGIQNLKHCGRSLLRVTT